MTSNEIKKIQIKETLWTIKTYSKEESTFCKSRGKNYRTALEMTRKAHERLYQLI